jgi:outer membrane receptor protein involved in Fe transport
MYAVLLSACTATAFAADPVSTAATDELQELIVTGSRISRPDFVSDSPIITASAEDLAASGKVNVETALEQMPQFLNGQDENYNAEAGGGGGRANVNLRGLGQQRTLVLLDGRRLSPTDGTGVANLNFIPSSLVDNIQVISGGASAAYGSDAMAGVVNIITKNINGLEFNASHGAANGGFGKRNDFSVTGGASFSDGRGHAMFSLQRSMRDDIIGGDLSFFSLGGQSTNTPYGAYAPTTAPTGSAANPPSQAAINAYFAQFGAAAGTVLNTTPLGFNDNGTLFSTRAPYTNYQGLGLSAGIQPVGGTLIINVNQYAFVTVPQDRWSAFTKDTYDLTDNTQFYFQALLSQDLVKTQNTYFPVGASALTTVPLTNPFIPRDLLTLLASRTNPNQPFTFSKRYLDFPPSRWNEHFDTDQVVVGAKGKIPLVDFDWDVYYMHDYSLNTEIVHDVISQVQYNNLLNAPAGGANICAGGFNPFQGYHSYTSEQCLAYLGVDTHTTTRETQDTVEANIGGKIVDFPAGEARFNLTSEWRHWDSEYSPDNLLVLGNPPSAAGGGTTPTAGAITVYDVAGEILVPLLKDKAFAKAWNINLAYRYSKYDVSGGASSYKFATDWRPVQSILVRGGYEHAIRAPNINDLYQGARPVTVQVGSVPLAGDPCDSRSALRTGPNGAKIAALCVAQGIPQAGIATYTYAVTSAPTVSTGSLLVKPEKADTFTVGAVFSPAFARPAFEHLQLSLDFYHIRISDAIGSSGYQYVIDNCYNASGANPTYSASNPSCLLIDRNFGGTPGGSFRIAQPTMNLGGLQTSGIDAELNWNWNLADLGMGSRAGDLRLSSVISRTQHFEIQQVPGAPWLEFGGTISLPLSTTPPVPTWHGLTSVTYQFQPIPVNVGVRWRYVGAMDDQSLVLNPASTIPGVSSYSYFDLMANWKITSKISLGGTITNVSNKIPPVVGGTPGQTQKALYDITGKTYLLSLHAKL